MLAALRQRRFSIVASRRAAAGLTSIVSGASLWGASVCFSVESYPGWATGRVALHDHGIPGFARCQGREVDGQLERSARRDDGVHVRPVEGGRKAGSGDDDREIGLSIVGDGDVAGNGFSDADLTEVDVHAIDTDRRRARRGPVGDEFAEQDAGPP